MQPEGLFYGGNRPTWSNRSFREILAEQLLNAAKVAFIDFHTGLGPYGHAELICEQSQDSLEYARLVDWYGPVVKSVISGQSASPDVSGSIHNALAQVAQGTELTCTAPEFGTYALDVVFGNLARDNWLHVRGDLESEYSKGWKAELRETFCPADEDWRTLTGLRGMQLLRRAVTALAA